MTEFAILAEQVGVSERTLRRALNQGTVRAERPTAKSLDLSLAERRYIRRSWPLLSALRSALRTEPNVRLALLFGSAARGTDGPTSDVDLVVSLRDPALEHLVDLSARLSAAAGRRVDVMRLEDAERDQSLLADVLSEGRVLVDRDAQWSQLRSRQPALNRRSRSDEAQRVRTALDGVDRMLARSR
jgi:uncharacterized protein